MKASKTLLAQLLTCTLLECSRPEKACTRETGGQLLERTYGPSIAHVWGRRRRGPREVAAVIQQGLCLPVWWAPILDRQGFAKDFSREAVWSVW